MPPVDYHGGKFVLAPMVRIGETPIRMLALLYGANLVWGPETVDRKLIGAKRIINDKNCCIEFVGRKDAKVIYRLHPNEQNRHIFQLGSSNPSLAVEAARVVAGDVAGIDLNCGCPKPFSIKGGMGASLLRSPSVLSAILVALVKDIGKVYDIGISCKIRLLESLEDNKSLAQMICKTGISALTVHCRTVPMRNRDGALHERIHEISSICSQYGVACYLNGDAKGYTSAHELLAKYNVDGVMIGRAAEANVSCFRSEGPLPCIDVAREMLHLAIELENAFGNTKYVLTALLKERSKTQLYKKVTQAKCIDDLISALQVVFHENNCNNQSGQVCLDNTIKQYN